MDRGELVDPKGDARGGRRRQDDGKVTAEATPVASERDERNRFE
jgi:hypothetical protein